MYQDCLGWLGFKLLVHVDNSSPSSVTVPCCSTHGEQCNAGSCQQWAMQWSHAFLPQLHNSGAWGSHIPITVYIRHHHCSTTFWGKNANISVSTSTFYCFNKVFLHTKEKSRFNTDHQVKITLQSIVNSSQRQSSS